PDAFELQKNVIVRFEKNAQIDKIVTAAAEAEIYDLVKVDHYLTDIKRHYDQLRKECLTALNEKVLAYEFAGIRLDTLARTIADDFGTVLPEKRYAGYSSVARPSFHAVKDAGSGSAKISNSQLAASRYYDALPYDEFDVVINPVIDQPVVQLTYQFKIRYYLSDEKRQAEYHFIGANGVIQKLDLK
ncbi:MAG TPA: hypothetical protein VEB86_00065, partial [Chryseosolibacter sp.]|nr:hypothetical protein [Chryseosolibacter sp.]